MKKSIFEVCYKLMIGSSLVMASFGFMIYCIGTATAKQQTNSNSKGAPLISDGIITVRLTDDQLDKIIPKNEDGSVNIKLPEQQLKVLSPNAIQSVNIAQIGGNKAANYTAYTIGEDKYSALGVVTGP